MWLHEFEVVTKEGDVVTKMHMVAMSSEMIVAVRQRRTELPPEDPQASWGMTVTDWVDYEPDCC